MTIIARLCEPAGLLKRSWSAQVINSKRCLLRSTGRAGRRGPHVLCREGAVGAQPSGLVGVSRVQRSRRLGG